MTIRSVHAPGSDVVEQYPYPIAAKFDAIFRYSMIYPCKNLEYEVSLGNWVQNDSIQNQE